MSGFIQVQTTVEKREDADRIAQELVSQRLAACVQICGPIRSTYWWRGRMETTEEWLCLLKTRACFFSLIADTLKRIHPYEVPQIVATALVEINDSYLRWLDQEIRQAP